MLACSFGMTFFHGCDAKQPRTARSTDFRFSVAAGGLTPCRMVLVILQSGCADSPLIVYVAEFANHHQNTTK
jgi:hypothetical protein